MAPPFKQTAIPFQLKGYPVSSYEEAKVASVDFDGSIFFFPDVANKKIYIKQINEQSYSTDDVVGQKWPKSLAINNEFSSNLIITNGPK